MIVEGRAPLRSIIARFLHDGYVVRAQLYARSWSLVLSRNVCQLALKPTPSSRRAELVADTGRSVPFYIDILIGDFIALRADRPD